jgi:hypothetical protein
VALRVADDRRSVATWTAGRRRGDLMLKVRQIGSHCDRRKRQAMPDRLSQLVARGASETVRGGDQGCMHWGPQVKTCGLIVGHLRLQVSHVGWSHLVRHVLQVA